MAWCHIDKRSKNIRTNNDYFCVYFIIMLHMYVVNFGPKFHSVQYVLQLEARQETGMQAVYTCP
jgi:hypothetical protein